MNILIINLTRFGDLLQLQPTILGLHAKGHKVGLICLENFYAATTLLRGLDYVLTLPGSKFLKGLDDDWRLALNKVEGLIDSINSQFNAEMIINTTSTLGARLLAKRIATSSSKDVDLPVLGFGLDADGFGVSGDMWAAFLEGASTERINCPFNLVDMFRSMCEVADIAPLWGLQTPNEQIQAESLALIANEIPKEATGYVVFQLGASHEKRQWAVSHFVRLGQKLWQEHGLCPVLLGTESEKYLEHAYVNEAKSFAHPFVSVLGKTDILHLAGVISQAKLLVSNDTGTMHLAAGLKIPTLAMFLATAQAVDTGPYMPDCCCLEPTLSCHPCAFHKSCVNAENGQACLSSISFETVFFLLDHYLQHKTWPNYIQNEARIWRTIEDEDGFASLESLSGHEQEDRSQWLMMQRHFYRRILDGSMNAECYKSATKKLNASLVKAVLPTLQQAATLLILLEKQIEMMQNFPTSQNGEKILITNNKLHRVLDECIYLKALAHLWGTLSQKHGGDLISFLQLVKGLQNILGQWQVAINECGT